MNTITIKMLSGYQIEQLRAYFSLSAVETVGVIIETGELVVECLPMYQMQPVGIQTIKIPLSQPAITQERQKHGI